MQKMTIQKMKKKKMTMRSQETFSEDRAKNSLDMKGFRQLWREEDGMGTVEIILIIVDIFII